MNTLPPLGARVAVYARFSTTAQCDVFSSEVGSGAEIAIGDVSGPSRRRVRREGPCLGLLQAATLHRIFADPLKPSERGCND